MAMTDTARGPAGAVVGLLCLVVLAADAMVVLQRVLPVSTEVGTCLAQVGARGEGGRVAMQPDPAVDLLGAELAVAGDRATLRVLVAGTRGAPMELDRWTLSVAGGADEADVELVLPRDAVEVTTSDDGWSVTLPDGLLDAGDVQGDDVPPRSFRVAVERRPIPGIAQPPLLPVVADGCAGAWPQAEPASLDDHLGALADELPVPALAPRFGAATPVAELVRCDDLARAELLLWPDLFAGRVDEAATVALGQRALALGCSRDAIRVAVAAHFRAVGFRAPPEATSFAEVQQVADCADALATVAALGAVAPVGVRARAQVALATEEAVHRVATLGCQDGGLVRAFAEPARPVQPRQVVIAASVVEPTPGCYDAVRDDGRLEGFRPVHCDDPHEFEVVRTTSLTAEGGLEWPGAEQVLELATTVCTDGGLLDTLAPEQDLVVLHPDETTWAARDRTVRCLVQDRLGRQLVGSAVPDDVAVG